jgi:hypothetical protein
MTDTVAVAAIGGFSVIVVAAITAFGNKLVAGQRNMNNKQDNLGVHMDGRLTELLDLTRKASRAEGYKDGSEHRP